MSERIQPVLKDQAFLDDVAAKNKQDGQVRVWWLGQSGYLVQWNGRHLLIDPYLSDSLTRKYANTDKPHIRMTERVVAPEKLSFIDVATSSHNHTDHLDGETLGPLLSANPELKLIIPEANRAFVAHRLGIPADFPIGLNAGTEAQACGFHFTGVPAAHDALETDNLGQHKYLGYLIQCGRWTLYHSGDTRWYPGMEAFLESWPIDLALLPINGYAPERRVAGNLNGAEAARLAYRIGAHMVIPCHYDMFTFNTAKTDLFEAACRQVGQPYTVLESGGRWSTAAL